MEEFTEEEIEKGRLLFAGSCDFMLSVLKISDLPPYGLPEICFAGRSNVGKSTLINALTGRKGLANTSNTPGRTQCLNYFNLSSQMYLVDMPGYGYAEAPKKLVKQWQGLIYDYLVGRPTLKRVFVLIDSRHGLKDNDKAMMQMLDKCAVSYQVVLTKTDKISKSAQDILAMKVTEALRKHGAAHPFVHQTSSEKKLGITTLRAEVTKLLG